MFYWHLILYNYDLLPWLMLIAYSFMISLLLLDYIHLFSIFKPNCWECLTVTVPCILVYHSLPCLPISTYKRYGTIIVKVWSLVRNESHQKPLKDSDRVHSFWLTYLFGMYTDFLTAEYNTRVLIQCKIRISQVVH